MNVYLNEASASQYESRVAQHHVCLCLFCRIARPTFNPETAEVVQGRYLKIEAAKKPNEGRLAWEASHSMLMFTQNEFANAIA